MSSTADQVPLPEFLTFIWRKKRSARPVQVPHCYTVMPCGCKRPRGPDGPGDNLPPSWRVVKDGDMFVHVGCTNAGVVGRMAQA